MVKQCRSVWVMWFVTAFAVWLATTVSSFQAAETKPAEAGKPSPPPAAAAAPAPAEGLSSSQQQLAAEFKELEGVLIKMHDQVRQTDPNRAVLIEKALKETGKRHVDAGFQEIVDLLRHEKFGDAAREQGKVNEDLDAILKLLLSENRSQEILSEKELIKKYLDLLNGIIREQKDVEIRTAGGEDPKSLAVPQGGLALKTGDLSKEVAKSEGNDKNDGKNGEKSDSKDGGKSGEKSDSKDGGKSGEKSDSKDGGKSGEKSDSKSGGKSGEKSDSKSGGKSGEKSDSKSGGKSGEKSDSKSGGKSGEKSDSKSGGKSGEKSDSKSGEKSDSKSGGKSGEKSDSKSGGKSGEKSDSQGQGKSKPSQSQGQSQGQGQPSEDQNDSPQQAQDANNPPQEQQEQNPLRKRLQAAQDHMNKAKKRLEDAKKDGALDEQEKALQEPQHRQAGTGGDPPPAPRRGDEAVAGHARSPLPHGLADSTPDLRRHHPPRQDPRAGAGACL